MFWIIGGIFLWFIMGYFAVRLMDEDCGIDDWADVFFCMFMAPVAWIMGTVECTFEEWATAHFIANLYPVKLIINKLENRTKSGRSMLDTIFRL